MKKFFFLLAAIFFPLFSHADVMIPSNLPESPNCSFFESSQVCVPDESAKGNLCPSDLENNDNYRIIEHKDLSSSYKLENSKNSDTNCIQTKDHLCPWDWDGGVEGVGNYYKSAITFCQKESIVTTIRTKIIENYIDWQGGVMFGKIIFQILFLLIIIISSIIIYRKIKAKRKTQNDINKRTNK
ncbi:MAG: hypothetical protein WCK11_00825 [Candidatus Falkowbacteria bacterium]